MNKFKGKAAFISAFMIMTSFVLTINTCEVKAEQNSKLTAVTTKSEGYTKSYIANKKTSSSKEILAKKKKKKKVSRSLSSSSKESLVTYAREFIGTPYVYGSEGPKSFDCSGFTRYVYSRFGVDLPHYTGDQIEKGSKVSKENLSKGDLVFFNTNNSGSVSHVGIYIGDGSFVHASSGRGEVIISKLDNEYYESRYAGARRISL